MNLNEALGKIIREKGIIKFVDIGATSLNQGVLQTAKLDAFIQEMKASTVLLDAARLIPMESFEKDIDRISMEIEWEAPVRDPTTGNETLTDQEPDFACNTLDAVKLRAQTRLTQESIEDNIQQGTLPNTITTIFGKAGGRALERVYIWGDTSQTSSSIPTGYRAVNGWIKKAASSQKLYGGGSSSARDFDPTDIDDMFTTMYDALDPIYRANARFWVPSTYASKYQRSLKSKDSNLGDQANLQNGQLTFEGKPVVEVPGLDWPINNPTFFGSEVCFFGPADQFVHGLWKTVTARTWEDIKNEMFYFFLRLRGDCHFENEEKVVVGLPKTTSP